MTAVKFIAAFHDPTSSVSLSAKPEAEPRESPSSRGLSCVSVVSVNSVTSAVPVGRSAAERPGPALAPVAPRGWRIPREERPRDGALWCCRETRRTGGRKQRRDSAAVTAVSYCS